jgi:hypothetical protein
MTRDELLKLAQPYISFQHVIQHRDGSRYARCTITETSLVCMLREAIELGRTLQAQTTLDKLTKTARHR